MGGKLVLTFSTESDPASAAVRFYSHSEFSHVDGVLSDGRMLGARSDGVQIRRPNYATFSRVRVLSIETDCAAAVYDAARSQIGKPYDWRGIAAFAFPGRNWRGTNSWFCSELWAWALEEGGFFKRKLALEANRITPGDLLLLLSPFSDT